MKYNYHCHTARCKHASGTDEAYVEAAIRAGFRGLGFSDHAPWPYASGYVSRIRMDVDALPGYIAFCAALREKYAGQIAIHTGLECEYYPRYADHIRRMQDMGVEYLILGQHFADSDEDTPPATTDSQRDDGALRYADSVANALRTGSFVYLAHPDLFMKYRSDEEFNPACERAADTVCQAAAEANVPIEFNLLGQLEGVGYPSRRFWKHAVKWHNRVILGVDAHKPEHFLAAENIALGEERVRLLGYELVERLPMDD